MAEKTALTPAQPAKSGMKAKKRPSYITRAFGHFMDTQGVEHGTWIVSLLYLETCPTYEKVREMVETRLLSMSRFKSVLKVNKHGGVFEEVDELDWEYHIGEAFRDKEVSEEELVEYVGALFERGLDVEKPLWKLTVIPKMDNGQTVLLVVTNHAIGDGVSTIGVLLNILDDSPIDPTIPLKKQLQRKQSKDSRSDEKSSAKESFVVQNRSKRPSVSAGTRVAMFLHGIKEGIAAPFGKHDPPNALKLKKGKGFKKNYTGRKLIAKTEPISLDEVKALKNKLAGTTVNDVLLALLTMTVRAYLQEIDDPVLNLKHNKSPLRGNFPVNLRSGKEPILKDNNPSNRWQPMAFRFPFDYNSPIDCVWKVKTQIDKAKVSPQLPLQHANGKLLLKVLPRKVTLDLMLNLVNKVTCMLSNVPGPQQEVHLAGAKIVDMNFYLFSPVGLYLGLISYNGKVSLTVNMDESIQQDPKRLTKHWTVQFQKLKEEVSRFPDLVPRNAKQRKAILENTPDEQQETI